MKSISQRIGDLKDQRQEVELHVSSFNEDKIKAVKLAREATPGLGLAEAKAFIEGTYNIKAEAHSVARLAKILEGIGCELQVAFTTTTTSCQSCDCATPCQTRPDLLDLFQEAVVGVLGQMNAIFPAGTDPEDDRCAIANAFISGGRAAVKEMVEKQLAVANYNLGKAENLAKAHIL